MQSGHGQPPEAGRRRYLAGVIVRSATITAVILMGGLVLGFLAGSLVFELIPGSSVDSIRVGHAAIAAVPTLACLLASGGVWGERMGRLVGSKESRRMAMAGLLGFGPVALTLALVLGVAEPVLVDRLGAAGYPIHRAFTFLFTPSAVLIAGVGALALGHGLREPSLAWALSWRVGLAAGAAFLVVNLSMEAAGWVVGAPGAAARATMLVVLSLGNLAAALVGGGVVGHHLNRIAPEIARATI